MGATARQSLCVKPCALEHKMVSLGAADEPMSDPNSAQFPLSADFCGDVLDSAEKWGE